MLNQDNWPGFYKEAASYFKSLGFRFELMSTEMAVQVGRTDQVTFILIAKYLETLTDSLPGSDSHDKMLANLGDFGKLLMENIKKYPDDYQYIFFITHQTQSTALFHKIMELGMTTMMYIDAQAEAARVDLKDEPLLLEFMNECVITLSKKASKKIQAELGVENVAGRIDLELLLDSLMMEAKVQYKLSRNVILN